MAYDYDTSDWNQVDEDEDLYLAILLEIKEGQAEALEDFDNSDSERLEGYSLVEIHKHLKWLDDNDLLGEQTAHTPYYVPMGIYMLPLSATRMIEDLQ